MPVPTISHSRSVTHPDPQGDYSHLVSLSHQTIVYQKPHHDPEKEPSLDYRFVTLRRLHGAVRLGLPRKAVPAALPSCHFTQVLTASSILSLP